MVTLWEDFDKECTKAAAGREKKESEKGTSDSDWSDTRESDAVITGNGST